MLISSLFGPANRHLQIIIGFLCLLWLVTLFLSVSKLSTSNSAQTDSHVAAFQSQVQRLNQALEHMDQSRQMIDEMRVGIDEHLGRLEAAEPGQERDEVLQEIETKILTSIRDELLHGGGGFDKKLLASHMGNGAPENEYELLRRRVSTNVDEFWNLAKSELQKVDKGSATKQNNNNLAATLNLMAEHKDSLLNDLEKLRHVDGYESWREQEAKDLSELVQKRLHYLQNPDDCQKARKLVCRLNKGCGYGCQIHHVVYCFIMAYATERTLILKSQGWRYNKAGWDQVFKPISDNCLKGDGVSHSTWPASPDTQVVTLSIIDSLNPRPPQLPLAIPADLAPRLTRLHGDPIVWWIGQFLKYLLQFQPKTQEMIDAGISKLNFRGPIVGVHIRRTDKVGTEAAMHTVEEYMTAVEDYYKRREQVCTLA